MFKEAATQAEHAEVKTFARQMTAKQEKEAGELNRLRVVLKQSHDKPAKGSRKRGTAPSHKHSGH